MDTSQPARGGVDALGERTAGALRDALAAAAYTVDSVTELLGSQAHAALLRDATVPGLRATGAAGVAGSPLATLTRLWPLQAPVPRADADRALPELVRPLVAAGVLAADGDEVRALVDVRPYGDEEHDWWVVSDLTPGLDGADRRVRPDHVLGVSPASTTLAQLTVRRPVDRALDLGTGCGVQALHLASHAGEVVGTDVNDRALAMARLTAALSGESLEARAGSLWEPVAGEAYDLIVTSPPFVVSPATGERLVYRDSGLPGDEVVRRIVTGAPAHLAPDGWCQVLANWAHTRDETWQERVGGWVAGSRCDAWVLQRELLDPGHYVETWLADAGLAGRPEWAARYDAWLGWMDEAGIDAVGMGWLCLRRTDRVEPAVRVEDWPYEIAQPMGPQVGAWATGSTPWQRSASAVCWTPDRSAPTTSSRRRTGCPGPRTRSGSSCGAVGGCGGPGRSTRSRRRWSVRATATSPSGRCSTRWRCCSGASPPTCGRRTCRWSATWSRRAGSTPDPARPLTRLDP